MKKRLLICLTILGSLFSGYNLAQEVDDSLYNLCSKFPLNSKCQGYEAPIALKDRSGEKASCLFSNQEKAEKCKVNFQNESIVFYTEIGQKLNVLDNSKKTEELVIPLEAIQSFSYSEKSNTDIGAVLSFGVWGLFAKQKTSTFNFRLKPEEFEETKIPKQAVFLIGRSLGREIRHDLEEKIGVTAEILDIE